MQYVVSRQCGVLSPYLFAYYIDDLIDDVKGQDTVFIRSQFFLDAYCMLTTLSYCLAVAMDYSKWWIFVLIMEDSGT